MTRQSGDAEPTGGDGGDGAAGDGAVELQVRAEGDGFVIDLGPDERAVVRKLLRELRELLAEPTPEASALVDRLFPVAHPDDADAEAEYQRLMREELVASKLAAFEIVDAALADDGSSRVDEGGLIAFMQSVNSVRLVLGTMLGVTDEGRREVSRRMERRPEYSLYEYLSYLLDISVRAVSGAA